MKLGELDIKKAYFGAKELTPNNAYIGTIPIIKDEEIPNNEIWYTSSDGNIVTPSRLSSLPKIDTNTYSNGKGIIKFKTDVTSIGNSAFVACTNLISITIPNSVIIIKDSAFYNCSSLTSINIPDSVISIQSDAFHNCSGLTGELVIPNSVTSIGSDTFYGCNHLTTITIPDSVTSIGARAFYDVLNIVYNGIATGSPWGAKCVNGYIDGYLVYSNATKTILKACSLDVIGEIIIPNSVTTINTLAFKNCIGLTSITIPNSVTIIRDKAFLGCTSLTSIDIPYSVTGIESNVFYNCNLTTVTINSNSILNPYISYTATDNIKNTIGSKVRYYIISNNVTSIGANAFYGCSDSTSIEIPDSVTNIGLTAFGYIPTKILFSKLYSTYINEIYGVPISNQESYTYNVEFNISEIPTGYNISSILPQNTSSGKGTLTYNIYTDYAPCKDQALALATAKTIVNVYHIDGTPWE